MNVRSIDPRDIESEMQAVYRVYFWSNRRGWCDSFELTGAADVHEVLDWINANASGREVEAMLVIDRCAAFLIGPLDHTG
jgi:hypothetical protein